MTGSRPRRQALVGLAVALALAVALGTGVAIGRARSSPPVAATPPDTTSTSTAPSPVPASDPLPPSTTSTQAPPPASPPPAPASPAGAPKAVGYAFPVEPAASATYGRTHHDYPAADLFAPCGTSVVAPTSGTITELRTTDAWSPSDDTGATRGGLSFTLVGDDGVRYYGSHLRSTTRSLAPGARIDAGGQIGQVGSSGNARGTGCHLHFGISPPCPRPEWRVRRGTIYPQPFLDSWRTGGSESPADAIKGWASGNPTACAAASDLPDAGRS